MNRKRRGFFASWGWALIAAGSLTACGGGGTGEPSARTMTTIQGNLVENTAFLDPRDPGPIQLVSATFAEQGSIEVCVDGTTFCTETDATGFFILIAPVSGDVVLAFAMVDSLVRLELAGIPTGAVVTVSNVRCSTRSGRCATDQVQVEMPSAPLPSDSPAANHPPVCIHALAQPAILFPPNHQMVPVVVRGVIDSDGDPLLITVTDIFQDEPVLGMGSGDTAPDASVQPLAVRAERAGQGNGRVYTIEFVAEDGHGGSCTGAVQVCVPHDQQPDTPCIDDGGHFTSFTS